MKPITFYCLKGRHKISVDDYKVIEKEVKGRIRKFAAAKCPEHDSNVCKILPKDFVVLDESSKDSPVNLPVEEPEETTNEPVEGTAEEPTDEPTDEASTARIPIPTEGEYYPQSEILQQMIQEQNATEVGQEQEPKNLAYDPSYFAPPAAEKEEAAEIGIIRELKPDDVLERVEMKLRGFEWSKTESMWKQRRESLLNDYGINRIMTVLSAVSEQITFSNYKEKDVPARVRFVCDNIIPVYYINWKKWGIQKKSDLAIIDTILFFFTEASLLQAVGAGHRNIIRGTYGESVTAKTGDYARPADTKRGFFSKINPFSAEQ